MEDLRDKLTSANIPFEILDKDRILIKGNADFDLEIIFENNGFCLIADAGEHHIDTINDMMQIISFAMDSRLKVINKIRGKTVVGSQLCAREGEDVKVLYEFGLIFSPFWKPLRFEHKYFKRI